MITNVDEEQLQSLLERLRRQGTDDATTEAKACAEGLGKTVWDSVSAFANTTGGLLLLGVSEKNGFRPAAGFDLDQVRDQFVSGVGDGGSASLLINPPTYRMERAEVDGAPVLLVEIDENQVGTKPCTVRAKGIEGGSYKRVDDKDVRLSPTEIFEMRQALLPQESDRAQVAEADQADLDAGLVDVLLSRLSRSRALQGASTRDAQLTRLNILNKSGGVRLAGLLAVGNYPQQFMPRLFIDVTVHPANEKASPSGPVRFVDRVACDGPLAEAIDHAVDVVARNLRTYSVVDGTTRRDQLEIPLEVLREAIANAAVHREYHELFRGQPVTVDVYPDRVVVTNPGGLWGGKTIDNLDDGTSRCRNQTLMQLLQSVPFSSGTGPTVEGQGSGIKLMISQMQAHAMDLPVFQAKADQVVVVLRRHGAEVPEHRAWLRELGQRAFTRHEDAALLMAKRFGTVTVARLHADLRIDSDDARELLRTLSAERLLIEVGPEEFALPGEAPPQRTAAREVLDALSDQRPMGINELAERLGKSPNALRPLLRELVRAGHVEPTAPPTSRNRKYWRTAKP